MQRSCLIGLLVIAGCALDSNAEAARRAAEKRIADANGVVGANTAGKRAPEADGGQKSAKPNPTKPVTPAAGNGGPGSAPQPSAANAAGSAQSGSANQPKPPGSAGRSAPAADGGAVDAAAGGAAPDAASGGAATDAAASGSAGHAAGSGAGGQVGSAGAGGAEPGDDPGSAGTGGEPDPGTTAPPDPNASSGNNDNPGVIGSVGQLVAAILTLSLTGIDAPKIAALVEALLALTASSGDALTPEVIELVLPLLGDLGLCQTPQACQPVCDLLFVSCTVCDHDRECRKTIKQVCGSQDDGCQ